jgi:hypothetical protein
VLPLSLCLPPLALNKQTNKQNATTTTSPPAGARGARRAVPLAARAGQRRALRGAVGGGRVPRRGALRLRQRRRVQRRVAPRPAQRARRHVLCGRDALRGRVCGGGGAGLRPGVGQRGR